KLVNDVSGAVHFVNNGGTVGGAITCSGLTSSGTVNANNGLATSGAGITTSGTGTFAHITMSGGNINLNGNNCNTANGYFVSGAPHRANLGTVTFNAAGLQSVADRADFIQNTEG